MTRFDKKSSAEILHYSIWFGLFTGLVEGMLLFSLHKAGWLTWRLQNRAYWYETLWIAPLIDLFLFLLAGGVFTLAGWIFPRLPVKRIAWFAFVFLAVFDFVSILLVERIFLAVIFILAIGISTQIFNFIMKHEHSASSKIRKTWPWLAGVTVLLFLANQGGGWLNERIRTSKLHQARADAPNVIVIVVDTLRADHLSSYGYGRNTSPFIDSLAAKGVRFKTAISAAPWTQPSHASMLTGRYTYEHQAEIKPLDNRFTTIGETMQTQGYRTAAFSGNTEFFTRRQGFGRGFLHFEDNYQSLPDDFMNSSLYGFIFDFYGLRRVLKYEGVPTRKIAKDVNRSVIHWIDKGSQQPFFVFINYFDVHDPYTPPQPYRSKYASIPNPGGLVNGYVERYHPKLTPEQLQSEIDAYDGSISYVDGEIEALFNELNRHGLLDNTIVIFTSDHGEELGEHGLLQHSTSLYLQEIHVPLIISGPGVPAGKEIDTPISTTSIPSTILSLVHDENDPFPGPSLAELIFSDNPPINWPDPIAEVAQFSGQAEQNPTTYGEMKSVVGTDLQYIVHEKFGDALYNWRTDPKELSNLANDPSFTTALKEFKSFLKKLIGEPLFKNP